VPPDLARFVPRLDWELTRWDLERAVYDAPSVDRPAVLAAPLRPVALPAWRAELRANRRTPYTFDPLWRAACEEMLALEAHGVKLPSRAAMQRARDILTAAARSSAA